MHRDGESSAEYEYNGASAATEHASRRRKQTMHRCGRAMAATAGASRPTAGQTMPCYGGATAKTEHLHRDGSSRADYTRIQRQGQSLHPYDDSRADYATLLRSNGSDISCVATAKAAQTMHGYNGATAQCLHRDAENREDNARIQRSNGRDRASARPGYQGRPAQWQRQRMHHIGQSREDYASLRRGRE